MFDASKPLGRRGGDEHVGRGQVAGNRLAVLGDDVGQDVGQVLGRRRRAAPLPRGAVHQRQALGHQPGGVHAVACLLDQLGNVDAHRADHRAAPAHVARVVDQLLPLLQVVDRRSRHQVQRAHQRCERAGLALVGAAEQLQLVDRRVLRLAGGDVEVAGLGAHPTAHAGLHVKRGRDAELANEAAHGSLHALGVALRALAVEGGGGRGRHTSTPRWLKRIPVAPRDSTNRKACISFPNGNQTSSAAMLSTCSASIVS